MTYYSERLLKEKFPEITGKLSPLPGKCLHDIRIEAVRDFIDLIESEGYLNDLYDVAGPPYDGKFVQYDELREAVKKFITEEYNRYDNN